jgi:tRNA (guanine37-N1)-methyltransferase
MGVPEVLLSGHHANIKEWQRQKALEITRERRPDLLAGEDINSIKMV